MGNGTGFDPFNQPVTLLAPDGLTKVTFPLSQVMELQQSVVCQAISSAIQTGAALILLLTLILITNREKRRSLVYLLNAFALLIIFVRGILTFFAYTGPFFNFYRWELQYYTNLRSGQDLSVAGEIMGFLLIAAIEFSLALQVRIVCCDLPTAQRLTVNAINALVAFIVAGVRFALMVLNILWNIVGVEYETEAQYHILGRLESATNITFVVSVGISTVLFCTKLAFAIASRRSLGMTQFGPMQIIFIMGCQTMCTPREYLLPCLHYSLLTFTFRSHFHHHHLLGRPKECIAAAQRRPGHGRGSIATTLGPVGDGEHSPSLSSETTQQRPLPNPRRPRRLQQSKVLPVHRHHSFGNSRRRPRHFLAQLAEQERCFQRFRDGSRDAADCSWGCAGRSLL